MDFILLSIGGHWGKIDQWGIYVKIGAQRLDNSISFFKTSFKLVGKSWKYFVKEVLKSKVKK